MKPHPINRVLFTTVLLTCIPYLLTSICFNDKEHVMINNLTLNEQYGKQAR